MPLAFDPYHRWLGIRPEEQPADHYRLLGLARFEDDPEVIRDAAERQIAHVRRYALGQHQAISQKILNELAAAKACLLNPDKKQAYDGTLRQAEACAVEMHQAATTVVPERQDAEDTAAVDAPPASEPPVVAEWGVPAAAPAALEPPASENRADWDPSVVAALTGVGPARLAPRWGTGGESARGKTGTRASRLPIPRGALFVVGAAAGVLVLIAVVSGVFEGAKRGDANKERGATAKAPTGSSNPAPVKPKPAAPEVTPPPEKKPEAKRESAKESQKEPAKPPPQDPQEGKREPEEPKPGLSKTPSPPPLTIAPFDSAQAKRHQEAWARHLGIPVEMSNSIGMRFVLIPPGEFDMGSTEAEVAKLQEEAKASKQPQWYVESLAAAAPKHHVRITKPFYLGMCEVTQAEYQRVVGTNPSSFKGDPTRPVDTVSWNDATAFCRKLGGLPQEQAACAGYRVPTEAEWEYACRAGSKTKWSFGDDEHALQEYAWCGEVLGGTTHPVAQKRPNAWGLYDMHGNVWEFCQDRWGDRYYVASPMDDPTGPSEGVHRVRRGGCWRGEARLCDAAYRNGNDPRHRDDSLGFRVVRIVSITESHAASPQESGREPPQSNDRPTPKPSERPASKPAAPAATTSKPSGPAPPLAVAPFVVGVDLFGDQDRFLFASQDARLASEGNHVRYWAPARVGQEGTVIYRFTFPQKVKRARLRCATYCAYVFDKNAYVQIDVSHDGEEWTPQPELSLMSGGDGVGSRSKTLDITAVLDGQKELLVRARLRAASFKIAPQFLRSERRYREDPEAKFPLRVEAWF
jgi:formylglycine-generating enzyme required for sulfatase activity